MLAMKLEWVGCYAVHLICRGKRGSTTDEELEHAWVLDLAAIVGALEAILLGDGLEGGCPDFPGCGRVFDRGATGEGQSCDLGYRCHALILDEC